MGTIFPIRPPAPGPRSSAREYTAVVERVVPYFLARSEPSAEELENARKTVRALLEDVRDAASIFEPWDEGSVSSPEASMYGRMMQGPFADAEGFDELLDEFHVRSPVRDPVALDD